jgi:hypothetical protein
VPRRPAARRGRRALLLEPCPVLVPPGFAQMTTLDFRRSVYPDTRDAAVADAEPAEA